MILCMGWALSLVWTVLTDLCWVLSCVWGQLVAQLVAG